VSFPPRFATRPDRRASRSPCCRRIGRRSFSAIDGMPVRTGRGYLMRFAWAASRGDEPEGEVTTSRGTLHAQSSDPSEVGPLYLAPNVPYLLRAVPRSTNT